MNYKRQCECVDDNCRTVFVGPDNRLDGIRCPRCEGPVNVRPFEQQKKNDEVLGIAKAAKSALINNTLLLIALESEVSVPKVFYKGEEINLKKEILFHWESKDDYGQGGLTYIIENALRGQGVPTVNRIERRIKDHACD